MNEEITLGWFVDVDPYTFDDKPYVPFVQLADRRLCLDIGFATYTECAEFIRSNLDSFSAAREGRNT